MSLIATAEPGTKLRMAHAGETYVFDFGDDGTRQVTEAEAAALRVAIDGGHKIEITEGKQKAKSGN